MSWVPGRGWPPRRDAPRRPESIALGGSAGGDRVEVRADRVEDGQSSRGALAATGSSRGRPGRGRWGWRTAARIPGRCRHRWTTGCRRRGALTAQRARTLARKRAMAKRTPPAEVGETGEQDRALHPADRAGRGPIVRDRDDVIHLGGRTAGDGREHERRDEFGAEDAEVAGGEQDEPDQAEDADPASPGAGRHR